MRYLSLTGEPFDMIGITAAQFLCGGVLLIPYLLLSGDLGASDWGSAELWWSIAFIVIGAQVLAYLTFYIALTRWPSSRVYPWTFLSPVVAILIEAFRGNLPGALPDGRHGDRRGRASSSSTCRPRRRPPCRRSREPRR